MARNAPVIDSYGDGGFRLDGVRHEGSLLIVADEAQSWAAASVGALTAEDFAPILTAGAADIELVLLGVGAKNALPPRAVRDALKAAGIGLDFMDTPAAARLYNLLTYEGRRVAAALIAV